MKEESDFLDAVLTDAKRPRRSLVSRAESVMTQLLLRRWVAGGLCLGTLCCFAIAGLWPFRQIPNQVTWIEGRQGIHFGKDGVMLSSGALPAGGGGECSVEMWVQPAGDEKSGTLLDFFGPGAGAGIALARSQINLRLDRKVEGGRPIYHYVFGDVLLNGKTTFFTVVSGLRGAVVYVDGVRVQELPQFRARPGDCAGNLAVGHSARGHMSWDGEIRGLAIYQRELTPDQILANYYSWITNRRPDTRASVPTVLYLFDEGAGRVVRDHGQAGLDLMIPEKYQDIERVWLESPHIGFQVTTGYVEDVLINIGGFVPFGFIFSAFLASLGGFRRVTFWTVLAGFVVSLAIESLQTYLPTRNSDLTDVVLNTLGASVGAWLHMIWSARLAKSYR
jgi:hypothetical protein